MNRPPLAAASQRLRGKPGRPRKAESGHITGTSDAESRMNSGPERGALAHIARVGSDGDTWGSDTSRCDQLVPGTGWGCTHEKGLAP